MARDDGDDEDRSGSAADAFRRLDAREERGTEDGTGDGPAGDGEPGAFARLRRQAMWLLVAAVAMVLVGFGAGWFFGRTAGPTASRLVLTERVEIEPRIDEAEEPPPGSHVAPTSGEAEGEPVCGVLEEPVPPERQVATLASGGVIVQYRTGDLAGDDVARLRSLIEEVESHVLVAPNPDLLAPVEATAWRVRLRLDRVERDTLELFVEGYRRPDPGEGACPTD